MKFLIVSLIVLFSFSVGLIGVTYGVVELVVPTIWFNDDPSFVEGYLQVQLRDPDGQLVAYYEPNRIWTVDSELVHEYLDTKENKSIISKDGRNFEVIVWEESQYYRWIDLKMGYGVWQGGDLIFVDYGDGFLAKPGDSASMSWTMVRPVP